MRFGIFLGPWHTAGQNPTLALERDLELVERLDQLGYHEAWIGEHHSAGWEIIACPEIFIMAAAGRTRSIRLGTGVVSLPYHHPMMVADRIVLLDHLTRGRIMLGVGPGSLPSDAFMMGIDPMTQRERMEESLEAIVALLHGSEPVTRKTDWFELRDARLQLRPYTKPCFEIAVAATVSPTGPRAAGRFGGSLISIGATTTGGFDVLGSHWQVMEERAAEFGTTVDRNQWRLVGPMHIAETEEQARRDVAHGLADWVRYFREVAALPLAPEGVDGDELVDALNKGGFAVIGTPEMAVAQIDRLRAKSGGFGTYLFMAHDWADREATLRSYELLMRDVYPRVSHTADSLVTAERFAADNRAEFAGAMMNAIGKAITDHHAEATARTPAAS
ncbi:MAG: LLM class flavin-dependent oxidoreductase [Acidimicrobiales bacterium]